MKSIFSMEAWIQQGAANTPQGRLVHADSTVMHSFCYQHIPHHPKGALFGSDMKSVWATGGRQRSASRLTESCSNVRVQNDILSSKVHCDHKDHILTVIHVRPPGVLRSCDFSTLQTHKASFPCALLTGVESGSRVLLQPIQFKVKWCVLSEMSFCTLLLYWAVIYLQPVEQVLRLSPLNSLTTVASLQAASDVQHSLFALAYSFHLLGFAYYPVEKKHSGLIFSHLHFLLTYFKYIGQNNIQRVCFFKHNKKIRGETKTWI